MALHDPEMECTCDNDGCMNSVYLPMSWSLGGYDLSDDRAESLLANRHDWLVVGGKHICDSCQDDFDTTEE